MITAADRASLDTYRSARAVVYTAPTVEPVSLDEAKLHCRVGITDDDPLLVRLITAARQRVEADCDRALVTQTWDIYYDGCPGAGAPLLVRGGKLQSVTSVTSYDTANASSVVSSATYLVDTASEPGRLVLNSGATWPTGLRTTNGLVVRAVVGYGIASAVPSALRQAVLVTVATLYEHREEIPVAQFGGQFVVLPVSYSEFIAPYQILLG